MRDCTSPVRVRVKKASDSRWRCRKTAARRSCITRWPVWFESSVCTTPSMPVTTAIAIIAPALIESERVSFSWIASRARLSRKAGMTPRPAETTISASRPVRRRQYGPNRRPTRRRFARRSSGSAGRSGASSAEWKNMPTLPQRTVRTVPVSVRLFAGLRERAGWSEREIEAATVADVWPALGLGDEPEGLLYAVNKRYADRATALADGDEVALIPPVSGGAFRLSDEPLDPAAVIREVSDPRAGGIATFIGTTRVQSRGRTVHYLDYEAYGGMAEQVMAELAEELKRKHELCEIAIAHRVGRVDIGEPSEIGR